MKALVLGGYGAVRNIIVHQLRSAGVTTCSAGRDANRADRTLGLPTGVTPEYLSAVEEVDVVVNAAGVEDTSFAATATPSSTSRRRPRTSTRTSS